MGRDRRTFKPRRRLIGRSGSGRMVLHPDADGVPSSLYVSPARFGDPNPPHGPSNNPLRRGRLGLSRGSVGPGEASRYGEPVRGGVMLPPPPPLLLPWRMEMGSTSCELRVRLDSDARRMDDCDADAWQRQQQHEQ